MFRLLESVSGVSTRTVGRGSIFERLQANRVKIFRDIFGVAPNVAEYWLEAIEGIMDDLDCTVEQKLKGAMSLLRDEAYQWWLTGSKIVAEYEAEFLRLSRYTRGIVATEYQHCVHFEDGLQDELHVLIAPQKEQDFAIRIEKAKIAEDVKHSERQNREKDRGRNKRDFRPLSSFSGPKKKPRFDGPVRAGVPVVTARLQPYIDCGRAHQGECWKRTGACFRCGSMDHQVRNCTQRPVQMQAAGQGHVQLGRGGQQPLRGRGQARGGNSFGRGRGTSGRGVGSTEGRQPGLVYAVHRREDSDTPNVITGTFLIYNVPYTALIDIGSTHSYVTCTVSSEITVLSPLGQSVRINKLFRDMPLKVQGVVFLADLMELPFGEFDLILGIDWLVKHCASLDSPAKRMVLRILRVRRWS
ncbi:uncharacterized protein LOC108465563 [Gossypium arboreum]|uniref:uncharacterized protein LOC108465563 n=1 Tax=Gossypium arboreum TaxID=29729 RepID=UPI00081974D1|nr:uncharacterized protein LOC108465563 [Gossypium arboreum]